MDPIRRHALTGLHGILQALDDTEPITVELPELSRSKFDALRRGEPETHGRFGSGWWVEIGIGGGVTLRMYTQEKAAKLRSVG